MPFDAPDLLSLGWLRGVLPSPCGRWLVLELSAPRGGALTHLRGLWRLALDAPERGPEPLAVGPWHAYAPCYRADGALAYLCDAAGVPQVWVRSVDGDAAPVTALPAGVQAFQLAAAADRLVVLGAPMPTDPRRPRCFRDAPVRGPAGWLPEQGPTFWAGRGDGRDLVALTPDAGLAYRDASWALSPDGAWLATTCTPPGGNHQLEAPLEVRSTLDGTLAARWPGGFHEMPRFSPDGRRLAARRHHRHPGQLGRPQIVVYSLAGAPPAAAPTVHGEALDWPTLETWTTDGRHLLVTAPSRGTTPAFAVPIDAPGAPLVELTADTGGSHEGVRVLPDGAHACGVRHRFHHPPAPFVCALDARRPPRVVAQVAGLAERDGARLRWAAHATPGGIPYFVTTPATKPPHPVLVWIHGGPLGAAADAWSWRWSPLVAAARGFAVVLPNPRGSLGYGQAFAEGGWHAGLADATADDVRAVIDDLARLPALAADRLGLWGGSFGGLVAQLLATSAPRVRCVVSHAAPFQLSALHGESDITAWRTWEMDGDPCDAPARYDRASPHLRVARWRVPALITHGGRDARVPAAQSQRLFEALRRRAVDAALVIYPDQGHQLDDFAQLADWYQRVFAFFTHHLGAEPAP